MNLSVNCGSCPSNPQTMNRLILGLMSERRVSARHSMRKGQMSNEAMTMKIVENSTRKLLTKAKPAPGPT